MEDKEKAVALAFGFLTLLAIVNWLILLTIKLARGFFWISLVGILIAFVSFIYFLIAFIKDEEELFYLEDESGLITIFSILTIIILYLFAGACYNVGYSDQAIKTEMEAKQYLQEYNTIMNLPNQAIEETIDSFCKDPNYPCQNTKQAYNLYKKISGWKSTADTISRVLVTAKRIDKQISS